MPPHSRKRTGGVFGVWLRVPFTIFKTYTFQEKTKSTVKWKEKLGDPKFQSNLHPRWCFIFCYVLFLVFLPFLLPLLQEALSDIHRYSSNFVITRIPRSRWYWEIVTDPRKLHSRVGIWTWIFQILFPNHSSILAVICVYLLLLLGDKAALLYHSDPPMSCSTSFRLLPSTHTTAKNHSWDTHALFSRVKNFHLLLLVIALITNICVYVVYM